MSISRRRSASTLPLKPEMPAGWQYYNNSINGMFLEEKGDLSANLDIVKWEAMVNKSFRRVIFGSLEKQGSLDFKVMIHQNAAAEMEGLKKVPPIRNGILWNGVLGSPLGMVSRPLHSLSGFFSSQFSEPSKTYQQSQLR
ncbi:hypothetical protein E2320_014181 [Naja naja]|nr:hypothetical protein E2320_014181 [Naja naja]